ncbi:Mur ligase [Mycotypha africana]|uniref:Mur ligase n=1 Tax=Mycotypha africana TaxID=64632 RepID=UPI002300BB14|nr:Mur ligase [Mycotypha africana]KAI8971633.1 Mur ligase [Mycotypha africana]
MKQSSSSFPFILSIFSSTLKKQTSRLQILPSIIITRKMSSTFTYEEAVDKLNSLQSNAALLEELRKAGPRMNDRSLPEMRQHFKRIGYEPKDFDKLNLIHVTGTKGKGSTSAFVQSILHNYPMVDDNNGNDNNRKKQIKTGLFTSPHLVAVRERIRINGKPISEELFAKYSQDVWERLEATKEEYLREMQLSEQTIKDVLKNKRGHPDKPTYFRYLTLVALHAFVQEKVDCAILEVGVGGEYDSTNIIEQPIVCGITALGLDHVSVLGNTIDQIAWHKSGIIKLNVPVVAFEQVPEAMEVIERRAREKNAPLTVLRASDISKLDNVEVGLAGIHQKYNALTAIEICKIWLNRSKSISFQQKEDVPEGFRAGLKLLKWPGRGQILPFQDTKLYATATAARNKNITWYLDGAHTVESLTACSLWFKDTVKKSTTASKRILMFNCTHGRDSSRLLRVISDMQLEVPFDHVIFTTNITYREGYTTDNTNKTVSLEEATSVQQTLANSWTEQVPHFDKQNIHIVDTIQDAVELSIDISSETQDEVQVLTTGSLIMVGNTLTVLGFDPQ